MGPNGSENFKTLLLLQITAKGFQTSPEFSSQWSSKKKTTFGIFEISKIEMLMNFFVFVNMGLYGSQNFKTLLLPQITFESFKFFLNFLLSGPHKSNDLDF